MEDFQKWISIGRNYMDIKYNVLGFYISTWELFIYGTILFLLVFFIFSLFTTK